jgi:hypothetical protein
MWRCLGFERNPCLSLDVDFGLGGSGGWSCQFTFIMSGSSNECNEYSPPLCVLLENHLRIKCALYCQWVWGTARFTDTPVLGNEVFLIRQAKTQQSLFDAEVSQVTESKTESERLHIHSVSIRQLSSPIPCSLDIVLVRIHILLIIVSSTSSTERRTPMRQFPSRSHLIYSSSHICLSPPLQSLWKTCLGS